MQERAVLKQGMRRRIASKWLSNNKNKNTAESSEHSQMQIQTVGSHIMVEFLQHAKLV